MRWLFRDLFSEAFISLIFRSTFPFMLWPWTGHVWKSILLSFDSCCWILMISIFISLQPLTSWLPSSQMIRFGEAMISCESCNCLYKASCRVIVHCFDLYSTCWAATKYDKPDFDSCSLVLWRVWKVWTRQIKLCEVERRCNCHVEFWYRSHCHLDCSFWEISTAMTCFFLLFSSGFFLLWYDTTSERIVKLSQFHSVAQWGDTNELLRQCCMQEVNFDRGQELGKYLTINPSWHPWTFPQ